MMEFTSIGLLCGIIGSSAIMSHMYSIYLWKQKVPQVMYSPLCVLLSQSYAALQFSLQTVGHNFSNRKPMLGTKLT